MSGIIKYRATHSAELERWLGREAVERMAESMRLWYGPPIAVAGVPGAVYVTKGGDFRGRIRTGAFTSALDVLDGWTTRLKRGFRYASKGHQLNAGFASLSDLIAEATTGKSRYYSFAKTGSTGVTSVTNSLWRAGASPPTGATPGNAPGGTAQNDTTTGGFPFTNPTGGDTQHFVRADVASNVIGNTLMLYDLIFGVNKTMNSTATESVTGVPTRYQSSTATDADYAGGNFLFIQVGGTQLAATGHNWTVCRYRNQAGADAQTLPSLVGNNAGIVDRLDHPIGQWFAPLATGDTGVMDLDQMQCDASVATGVIWFMIGHPIAMFPTPLANTVTVTDGIMTAFNLTRIFDDACLAFLEICKPSATVAAYWGLIQTVAG